MRQSENPDHGIYDDETLSIGGGCGNVLGTLHKILIQYNGLNEREEDEGPIKRSILVMEI